jgi:hypothetical protein
MPAPVDVEQQMARVNVSDEEWLAFRMEAIRTKRSVATYLGHLVAKELRRIDRRDTGAPSLADALDDPA